MTDYAYSQVKYSFIASSNVSTVSQGIVRMQGLPFRATEDDIVSALSSRIENILIMYRSCLDDYITYYLLVLI